MAEGGGGIYRIYDYNSLRPTDLQLLDEEWGFLGVDPQKLGLQMPGS